jgi:hypothetical protein
LIELGLHLRQPCPVVIAVVFRFVAEFVFLFHE